MSEPAVNLHRLSRDEKLRLLEELWDDLSQTPGEMPISAEQEAELDRRLDDLDREGPIGIPWSEVLEQIRKQHR